MRTGSGLRTDITCRSSFPTLELLSKKICTRFPQASVRAPSRVHDKHPSWFSGFGFDAWLPSGSSSVRAGFQKGFPAEFRASSNQVLVSAYFEGSGRFRQSVKKGFITFSSGFHSAPPSSHQAPVKLLSYSSRVVTCCSSQVPAAVLRVPAAHPRRFQLIRFPKQGVKKGVIRLEIGSAILAFRHGCSQYSAGGSSSSSSGSGRIWNRFSAWFEERFNKS